MFTTIVEWLVFLTVVGIVTTAVVSIASVVYMTMTEESAINATLFLTGFFGTIFFVIAPFIFNGVIPANNWGMFICFSSWLVAVPACIFLSTLVIERR